MTGQMSWRRLLGDNYSSCYNEPTLTFNTITFVSSSLSYLRLPSNVQFIICVGHKVVKSVVYTTTNSQEFLMMSPLFQNDGDSCNTIIFVIYYD